MSIDKMFQQFKSDVEKNDYMVAQHKTITDLTKKNKVLQEEIEHLKSLVTSAVPIIGPARTDFGVYSDEEETAKMEIRKLRDKSLAKELTLEEAKRLEIYTKILVSYSKTEKPKEREVEKLDSDQLVLIAEAIEVTNK